MTQIISQCMLCKHFNVDDLTKESCKAFPAGIPRDVLLNKVWHDKPVEGDHDVQFEPANEAAAEQFVRIRPKPE